jgi:hypothetical protein
VLAIGAAEAILLSVKYDYFTGGFLATNVLSSIPLVVTFCASGFVLDTFLVLGVWALLVPLLRRLGLSNKKTFILIGLTTLGIPCSIDYMNYELHSYLSDMMDLSLIWEIAGRDPREILVQWGGHMKYATIALVCGALLLFLVIGLSRRIEFTGGRHAGSFASPRSKSLWVGTVFFGLLGAVVITGLTVTDSPVRFGLLKKPSGALISQVIQFVTDLDRDGYGFLSRPHDTAPFDSQIHPYAIDVPGNGIDENGVGGDHPKDFRPDAIPLDESSPWTRTPSVLLILLESFRADMTERQVNGRDVTPFINRLAKEGARSSVAYSHCGYTVPGRAQLFGGRMLPFPGQSTLIDDFKRHGYYVGYFSGQDDSFGETQPLVGYDRADTFYDARSDKDKRYTKFSTPASLAVSCKLVNQRVLGFLERFDSTRPLFLYVNYHDTHFPYHHRELDNVLGISPLPRDQIRPGASEAIWKTYANAAANVDQAIAQLFGAWRKKLNGKPQVVIITADHGESLFEHGFLGHGYSVDDEQSRIPFVVWGDAGTWYEPLGLADIRGQLLANLQKGRDGDSIPPRIIPDSSRRVMLQIGPFRTPRVLAWRTLDEVMTYDFWNDSTVFRKRGSREVDGRTAGLDPRLIRLIWDWEAIINEQALGPSAEQIKNGGKWSSPH